LEKSFPFAERLTASPLLFVLVGEERFFFPLLVSSVQSKYPPPPQSSSRQFYPDRLVSLLKETFLLLRFPTAPIYSSGFFFSPPSFFDRELARPSSE